MNIRYHTKSGFVLRIGYQSGNNRSRNSRGNPCAACGKSSLQYADQSFLVNGFFYAFCKIVSEAGQRDGCAGASEVNQINRIKLMLATANKNLADGLS